VVRVRDLERFVERFFSDPSGQMLAPISRHRAAGMAHNPFAHPDDPALLVAYDGQKIVAYHGILSGMLKSRQGISKVFWGTAVFVHPDYRTTNVFLNLVRTALSFNEDYVISGFTDSLYRIYKALGFCELKPLETSSITVSNLNILANALWAARNRGVIPDAIWPLASRFSAVTRRLVYVPLRTFYFRRLFRMAKVHLVDIKYRERQRLERDAEMPLAHPAFVRGVAAVNWMLEYPWILQNSKPTFPPYFFSDVLDSFRQYAIEFDNSNGIVSGYLAFSIQTAAGTRILKLTDFSAATQKDVESVFWIAAHYAARHQVDLIEASSAMKSFMAETPLARFLVCSGSRRYFCRAVKDSPLYEVLGDLQLQYGDGDCAFT
jgi:hypothetical protein